MRYVATGFAIAYVFGAGHAAIGQEVTNDCSFDGDYWVCSVSGGGLSFSKRRVLDWDGSKNGANSGQPNPTSVPGAISNEGQAKGTGDRAHIATKSELRAAHAGLIERALGSSNAFMTSVDGLRSASGITSWNGWRDLGNATFSGQLSAIRHSVDPPAFLSPDNMPSLSRNSHTRVPIPDNLLAQLIPHRLTSSELLSVATGGKQQLPLNWWESGQYYAAAQMRMAHDGLAMDAYHKHVFEQTVAITRFAFRSSSENLKLATPVDEQYEYNLASAFELLRQGALPYRDLIAQERHGEAFSNIAAAREKLSWIALLQPNYWRMRYLEHRLKSIKIRSLQSFASARAAEQALLAGYSSLLHGDGDLTQTYFKIGSALTDLAISLTPVIGTSRDLFEALTGLNLITGEELSRYDRAFAAMSVLTLGSLGGVAAGRKAIQFMIAEREGFKGAQAILQASDDAASAWRQSFNIERIRGASHSHLPDYAALRARLRVEETIGEIWSKLNDTHLSSLIPGSTSIIPGARIGDPIIRSLLIKDGGDVADWAYYEYLAKSRNGTVALHYYWNLRTKRVMSNVKIKVSISEKQLWSIE